MKSDFNFRDIKLSPSILEVQRSQVNNLETSNLRNALVHNNWKPSLDEGHFKSVRANSLHYSNRINESLREDDLEAIITCPHCGETYRTYINDFVSSWEEDGEDGVGICPFCEEEFYIMESEPEIIEKRPFVESTESIGNHKHMSQESIKLDNFNKNGLQNDVVDSLCEYKEKIDLDNEEEIKAVIKGFLTKFGIQDCTVDLDEDGYYVASVPSKVDKSFEGAVKILEREGIFLEAYNDNSVTFSVYEV